MPRDDTARRKTFSRQPWEIGHGDAVRFINETLKGPVADVFRSLIPAFGSMSGEEFYESVLGSSELLHGCIRIFRHHRSAFRALLVDHKGRAVNDDFVRLRCGRSVHDIIAMIVRTHAKRHFRASLGGDPSDPSSRSGRMYQAINEYLIHDWQVSLVPHYAPLPVHKVQEMGPRLLDLRDPELLDAIVRASGGAPPSSSGLPAIPPPPLPPRLEAEGPGASATVVARRGGAFMSSAAVMERFAGTPQEEFWWEAITDRQVSAALGERSGHEMRELVAALAGVNETVRSELFAGLSLSTQQAAVCLSVAFRVMGRNVFGQVFGEPGKRQVIVNMAGRMRTRGVSSRTDLKTLAGITESAARL